MSRTALVGAFVFVVAGLSGCATPVKVIQQDANSVTVAIPDNTNSWPFYYRDEATKAATQTLADVDPVPISTKRVKVGTTTTNTLDTAHHDIGGGENKPPIGDVTTSRSTTSTSDAYEYRLVFQKKQTNSVPNSFIRTSGSNGSLPPPPNPSGPPMTVTSGMPPTGLVSPVGGLSAPSLPPPPTGAADNIVMPPSNPPTSTGNIPPTTLTIPNGR
jgi:hypothetical protein